jgi:hypothetical protein
MVFGKVKNQRGAGTIGCLFMVALIASALYAGYQFGLPRLRHSSFDDRVTELFPTFVHRPAAEVQKEIIQIASDFDIELTPAQVKVEIVDGRLRIDVRYEKLIDLKVWQKTVSFHLDRYPAP